MIAGLVRCYVSSIQNGGVPCIETAVETTARPINSEAICESVQLYKDQMSRDVTLPTATQQQLSEANLKCQSEATALFLSRVIFDKDRKYQLELTVEYKIQLPSLKNISRFHKI